MFADDTNLFFNSDLYSKLYEKVYEQFQEVNSWLTANRLALNIIKTKRITIYNPNSKPPPSKLKINLKESTTEKVMLIRFLGIIIHKHLTWKPHTKLLLNKLRVSQDIIKTLNPILTSNHSKYFTTAWFKVTINTAFHRGASVIKH